VWKALLLKELRECGLYAAIALVGMVHFLGDGMGWPVLPFWRLASGNEIPFLSQGLETIFATIGACLGIVLGLHQTLWESWRQTNLFLLHRPLPREQVFLAKLAAGGILLGTVTVAPLSAYVVWAATPGTHASPFFWGMTEPWWRCVALSVACYLGAFLMGLRPAAWLGSRTWPLITAGMLAFLLVIAPIAAVLAFAGFAVLWGALTVSILSVAGQRDYP